LGEIIMLKINPIINQALNQFYVAQTFTRWREGVARTAYADAWLEWTGHLSESEIKAIQYIQSQLRRMDGMDLFQQIARGQQPDETMLKAFAHLEQRVKVICNDAEPNLYKVKERLAHPPEWFDKMNLGLDHFFGIDHEYHLNVFLLPSPAGWTGGTGSMLVGPGAMTLECSGNPDYVDEELFITVLHESAHAIHQPTSLEPAAKKWLSTFEGQRVEEVYSRTPVAQLEIGFTDYIGELTIHSILDAMRNFEGLSPTGDFWENIRAQGKRYFESPSDSWTNNDVYNAWIMVGAAEMIETASRYVRDARKMDDKFINIPPHEVCVYGSLKGASFFISIGEEMVQ
jgi:hypothetical protein